MIRFPRAVYLLVGCGLVAAACSVNPTTEPEVEETSPAPTATPTPSPTPSPTPIPSPSPTPTPSPTSALPEDPAPADPYALSENEVYPNAKRLASDVAQALTTYDDGDSLRDIVADVAPRNRVDELVAAAGPLFVADAWSRGRVVYPQLGGITDNAVSVMVVTEQEIGTTEGTSSRVLTLDVRLRLRDGAWVVHHVASTGGEPPDDDGDLSPEAQAVLDHPRIELPDSAVWDIRAGRISPTLLAVMARAADEVEYGAVVLATGHPLRIFGTDRESDHTRGRAIDIYRVGDANVVDDREDGSATYQLVEWLYDQPDVARIGSPWALDDFGGRSWTDALHQDHIHVAVAE